MNRRFASLSVVVCLFLSLSLPSLTIAQTSPQTSSALPRLVRFGGVVKDLNSHALTGVVGVTFALYSEQTGGAALWMETQNVTADSSGHYTALLGSTRPEGLPSELFTAEQARWVGVQVSGQAEQARVLLVSAPYAFKAGDAETIGGLPPSAFVLATPAQSSASWSATTSATQSSTLPPPASAITGTGTVNYLPLWDTTSDIVSSVLFQAGTGATAKLGINTATPASTLDVKGGSTIRGTLSLPATGTATATAGKNSQPLTLAASAFNSATSKAGNQTFQWQAEPAGNDTASASGTLNLLFGAATPPTETGLNIAGNGQITFATGQKFPGTGAGTVTSVAGGSGLTGGPITGSGTLSIATGGVTTEMLATSSLTVKAGTDLTGGGSVPLGGTTTLNLDTTKVPLLSTNNTFSGNQTVSGGMNVVGDTRVDYNGLNKGSYTPAIRFGSGNTGEAIASDRTGSANQGGIDLYTNFTPRVSVTNTGSVGIGTTAPGSTLDVRGTGSFSAGVVGLSNTATNAVFGNNSATSGSSNGAAFYSNSPQGTGVVGVNTAGGYAAYFQGPVSVSSTTSNFPGLVAVGFSGTSVNTDGLQATGGSGSGLGGRGVLGQGGSAQAVELAAGGDGGDFFGGNVNSGFPGYGIYAKGGTYPDGSSLYAGYFNGNLNVTGAITAGTKDFKIDHPLDPANKYLFHASVESSEMKNIYDGKATTDGQGNATVQLPEWFEALNTDFRYQLTVIGQFAQAIVSGEVANHQFSIKTDKPNVKVSWQITGVRQDVFAKAHPLVVEQEKNARERGYYIHPELYGASEQQSMEWARDPQLMKRVQETRARQLAGAQNSFGTQK